MTLTTRTVVTFTDYEPGLKGRTAREKDRVRLADMLQAVGVECSLMTPGGVPAVVVEYPLSAASRVGAVLTQFEETL